LTVGVELDKVEADTLGVAVEISVGQSILVRVHQVVHLPRLGLAGRGQKSSAAPIAYG